MTIYILVTGPSSFCLQIQLCIVWTCVHVVSCTDARLHRGGSFSSTNFSDTNTQCVWVAIQEWQPIGLTNGDYLATWNYIWWQHEWVLWGSQVLHVIMLLPGCLVWFQVNAVTHISMLLPLHHGNPPVLHQLYEPDCLPTSFIYEQFNEWFVNDSMLSSEDLSSKHGAKIKKKKFVLLSKLFYSTWLFILDPPRCVMWGLLSRSPGTLIVWQALVYEMVHDGSQLLQSVQ